jgi:hypothetical protein
MINSLHYVTKPALYFHTEYIKAKQKGGIMQAITLISDLLKYNTGYLAKHLTPIDKSRLFIRPDFKANPIIWILGHIVVSRGSLIELLGEEPQTESLDPYFSSGTTPLSDPSEYPHFDEIMGMLGKLSTRLVRKIVEGGDSFLNRQAWGDYDTLGKHIAAGYIHETYHIGQITYLLNLTDKSAAFPNRLKLSTKKKESTGKIFLNSLKSVLTVK